MTELPDPVPKDDEYVIEVHAAAANFFDILQVQGRYQNQPREFFFLTSTKPLKSTKKSLANQSSLLPSSLPMGRRSRVRRHRRVHAAQEPDQAALRRGSPRLWCRAGRLCDEAVHQGGGAAAGARGLVVSGRRGPVCDGADELWRVGGEGGDQGG